MTSQASAAATPRPFADIIARVEPAVVSIDVKRKAEFARCTSRTRWRLNSRQRVTSLLAWFCLDSAGSLASGSPSNAAINVLVLLLAVGPMWRPARLTPLLKSGKVQNA